MCTSIPLFPSFFLAFYDTARLMRCSWLLALFLPFVVCPRLLQHRTHHRESPHPVPSCGVPCDVCLRMHTPVVDGRDKTNTKPLVHTTHCHIRRRSCRRRRATPPSSKASGGASCFFFSFLSFTLYRAPSQGSLVFCMWADTPLDASVCVCVYMRINVPPPPFVASIDLRTERQQKQTKNNDTQVPGGARPAQAAQRRLRRGACIRTHPLPPLL